MTFSDLVNDDVSAVFLDTDVFAVEVEYHPVGGGGKRTITATPAAERPTRFDKEQFHEIQRQTIHLFFKNDSTTGITDPKRGDFIMYLEKKWDFQEIVSEDSRSLTIEWRQSTVINSGRVNTGL